MHTQTTMAPQAGAWPMPGTLDGDAEARLQSFTALGMPRLVAEVLVRRGFMSPEHAAIALLGSMQVTHTPPEQLPDLRRAVALTVQAIAEGRPLMVRGDYDCDGVSATAVLVRGLTMAGGSVSWEVPRRDRDGRDFTAAQAAAIAPRGGLLFCVDHGTNSPEALAAALARGADVIVLDHHRPQALPQPGVLCVNPHRPDTSYPAPDVCATFLCWHFLRALAIAMGHDESTADWACELVAIATLGDSMPLLGENRAVVRAMLAQIPRTRLPGLRTLLRVARLSDRTVLTERDIVFDVVPRLNAAGRMGDAGDAVRLLLAADPVTAARLAALVEMTNDHRRATEERVFTTAWKVAAEAPSNGVALVVRGHDWHPGVVSIVSARLAERFRKPAMVLVPDGLLWRGSVRAGRSGHDVFRAVESCARFLEAWGGHRAAVGVTVQDARLEEFLVAFEDALQQAPAPSAAHLADARLAGDVAQPDVGGVLTSLPEDLGGWLRRLAPFGQGFRPMRVVVRGTCAELDRVGVHRTHLGGVLRFADGTGIPVFGSRLADIYAPEFLRGMPVEIVGQLDLNRGMVRLLIEGIQARDGAGWSSAA